MHILFVSTFIFHMLVYIIKSLPYLFYLRDLILSFLHTLMYWRRVWFHRWMACTFEAGRTTVHFLGLYFCIFGFNMYYTFVYLVPNFRISIILYLLNWIYQLYLLLSVRDMYVIFYIAVDYLRLWCVSCVLILFISVVTYGLAHINLSVPADSTFHSTMLSGEPHITENNCSRTLQCLGHWFHGIIPKSFWEFLHPSGCRLHV